MTNPGPMSSKKVKFWFFLQSDWHILFEEFKRNNPNCDTDVPSVISINRLDYKLEQLKLPVQKLTKLVTIQAILLDLRTLIDTY